MLVVPDVFRRPELYPGEDLPNHGKSEIMSGLFSVIFKGIFLDWVLVYREFCFPGLGFDALCVLFPGIGFGFPGVQFPSPIEAWDVQLPDGDVNRPPACNASLF